MRKRLSSEESFKNFGAEDVKELSPRMVTKLPLAFWEEAPAATILSMDVDQLEELDIPSLARIIDILNQRAFDAETKKDIDQFIRNIPDRNVIGEIDLEVDAAKIESIRKLTDEDIKRYSAKKVAELPIYFWDYVSFEAIHKISKTQLKKLDKFKLNQIRKIVYNRFSDLRSKEYYSLINRIQFQLMVLRRTSASNIFVNGIEYMSMYKFYNLLRYATVPEYSILQRIEKELEVHFNESNGIKYYSVRSLIKLLNIFYLGPEKEPLTELPDEFLTIPEAMGILGYSKKGRETLNERIGCYKVGRFPEDVEDSENPNKAKKTLFLLDDVKRYAFNNNRLGILKLGILEEDSLEEILENRYSELKTNN